MDCERLAALAAAATGIQVGAAMVATRFVIDQLDPVPLAMLRYAIGFLCLLPLVLLAPRARFARRDILPIALLGITQFGILIALLNYGLQFISAGRAALIFATFPLMTLVLARLFGREAMTGAKTAGVLLTVVGVAAALGEAAYRGGASGALSGEALIGPDLIGVAAVLASAFCGALCSILYRPYLQRYPTLPVSAFAMLASVGFLALLAGAEGAFGALPRVTAGGWLAILFIGVSSGVGYYLWLWALRHATPTRVTVFLALSPLTAALGGALLLGEALGPGLAIGLACVALGLWLAHRPTR